MTSRRYEIILVEKGRDLMPLEELAARAGLHPDLLRSFVDFGLLDPIAESPVPLFDVTAARRLRVIQRLRCDLGINLAGIGVILDLLERPRRKEI
ncbi:MAG TPA: chaperone modulator CbpM [Terriglobia bacterium]|nr:chaperone modulator CbpM [Terriglobia bacterium]